MIDLQADSVRTSGFYSDKRWIELRDYIRKRDKMTCQLCGDFTAKKYEVDHIEELNMNNVMDFYISLNPDNLQLLCFDCHRRKTARDKTKDVGRLLY